VPVDFESEFFRRRVGDFNAFGRDFRAGAVAAEQCDVVSFHIIFRHLSKTRGVKIAFFRMVTMKNLRFTIYDLRFASFAGKQS
jgi:hypothetical protein